MKISHVKISNFRALQDIEVPLNRFSVLLGENDVGKTSFLYALDNFFAGKKISDKEDFFQAETDNQITITLTFDELDGEERTDLGELVSDDKVVIQKTFLFGKTPEVKVLVADSTEQDIGKDILKKYFSSESFHFIPVHRDLSIQFSMNKTALLGKTIRAKMRDALEDNKDDSLEKVRQVLEDSLEDPRTKLERFLKEQMHNEEIGLVFDELNVDPVEGISFRVKLSDDKVEKVSIENRGAGTQNNLIIALFRLVADLQVGSKLIFAMEEPENSLHPKAQRQLLSVLQDISDESQVIVTTHSPVFIERSKFENNVILTRTARGNTIAKTFNVEMLKTLRTDLGIRPSDALLKGGGNCAVLVEGNTEEEAFPVFMEMMGFSEFKLGIAIINLRGSDNYLVQNTARLLLAYDIPCVVVLDKDKGQVAEDIKRASTAGLPNIKEVFCHDLGTMEDFYPLEIVAEVVNEELNPEEQVDTSDFDESKHGSDRLSNFKEVMYKKGAGKGIGYLKRMLGSVGTKKMKEQGIPVPDELQRIFEKVKEVASE